MATGSFGVVNVKYFVLMLAPLIVIDAVPEFTAVTLSVFVVPAVTLPKSRPATPRERVLDGGCDAFAVLRPWQPVKVERPSSRSRAPATFAR